MWEVERVFDRLPTKENALFRACPGVILHEVCNSSVHSARVGRFQS